MSFEVIKPAELLGAYLSNELSPEERTAVERLLNDDPIAVEQLDELRELTVLLKEGESEVSQATIDALRRTVLQKIHERQLKALVTVSITGDLTEQEKADVKAYLNAHPAAEIAQKQALTVAALLKQGNCVADGTLADKLREKLKSALPAAAMVRSQKTEPLIRSASASSESARTSRPSLRVFVRPETPWKKRFVVVATSLAALLAIGLGVRAWWTHVSPGNVANVPKKNPAPEEINSGGDQAPHAPNFIPNPDLAHKDTEHVVPPDNGGDRNMTPPKAPGENLANQQTPSVVPPKDNQKSPSEVVRDENPEAPNAPSEKDVPRPDAPKVIVKTDPKNNVAPDIKNNPIPPNNNVPPPDQQIVGAPPMKSNGGVPFIPNTPNPIAPNNPTQVLPTPPVAVVPGVVPPMVTSTPPNGLDTTSVNTTNPQQNGTGTVGSVKNGDVQITVAGVVSLAKANDKIASGSQIDTDKAVISINIGGGGLLYIKANSSVVVKFGVTTSVTITAGEIYYNAATAGKASLSVTAGKVQASNITEADISLSAGRLNVLNESNAPLKVGAYSCAAGDECSAAADGSDTWRKDTTLAITDNGIWRLPVQLAGDSIKAQKSKSRK